MIGADRRRDPPRPRLRRTIAARPASGHVHWAATFRALRAAGYDGWLTIEAFGTALPALAAATKVWRDFFASREEVYEHGPQDHPRRPGRPR